MARGLTDAEMAEIEEKPAGITDEEMTKIEEPEVSAAEAAKLGALQGSSMKLADEGAGIAGALSGLGKGQLNVLENYQKSRDAERAKVAAAKAAHPMAFGAAEAAPDIAWRTGLSAVTSPWVGNAIVGGVSGFGGADKSEDSVIQGVKGAMIDGATAGALTVPSKIARYLRTGSPLVQNLATASEGGLVSNVKDAGGMLSKAFEQAKSLPYKDGMFPAAVEALKRFGKSAPETIYKGIEQTGRALPVSIGAGVRSAVDKYLSPKEAQEEYVRTK